MTFNRNIPQSKTLMFLDPSGPVGVARYDRVKYPQFAKLAKRQRGFFWTPDEVSCKPDGRDFKTFTDHEQHIFTSNIKRQIVLDSKQGTAVSAILAPICSLPEVEHYIQNWNYFETIHSLSYTHIIQGVYADPTKILDEVLSVQPVLECADAITAAYDDLERHNILMKMHDDPWFEHRKAATYSVYEHKKALWRCLNAVNALEGVRFYVSFACSWAFAELKKMEGNAKIIKFIARDENLHLAGTQQMLKLMVQEDPEMAQIAVELQPEIEQMFIDVVSQETAWAEYLFKDGSMIGLNAELLTAYVQWIAHKRMQAIGLNSPYKGGSNPLPWTQKWIAGSDVQVAPQEVEVSSYIVGGYDDDWTPDKFQNFQL